MRWYRALFLAAVRLHHRYYLRAHGLKKPATQVGSILQVELTVYRGPSRRLPDGTLLRAGDPIGSFHLNNERVRALHCEISHPGYAGIQLRREFARSLGTLACRTETDARYRNLKAFFTETFLAREHARSLGFEIQPVPDSWISRLKVFYLKLLMAEYHPQGWERAELLGGQQLVTMTISAAALRARYREINSISSRSARAR